MSHSRSLEISRFNIERIWFYITVSYGPILYRFPHIARYWSKWRNLYTIRSYLYSTGPVGYSKKIFSTGKTGMMLKKVWWFVKPFRYSSAAWQTGWTKSRSEISLSKNTAIYWQKIANCIKCSLGVNPSEFRLTQNRIIKLHYDVTVT